MAVRRRQFARARATCTVMFRRRCVCRVENWILRVVTLRTVVVASRPESGDTLRSLWFLYLPSSFLGAQLRCVNTDLKLTPQILELLRQTTAQDNSGIRFTKYAPCLCGKLLDVAEHQRKLYSGKFQGDTVIKSGINYTDLVCSDCRKEFHKWSRVVCIGCRSLMGFYKPGRQKTGFVFDSGAHYHILECPRCRLNVKSTPVLEHEKFCRDRGIATPTNQDLIQEIEQKILQAELAANKLRLEYEKSKQV